MKNKLSTIKEIAKRLRLSVSTVSRALLDNRSIGNVTKIRERMLAKQLHYQPNRTATSFRQGKTFTIGVVLPELGEAFFSSAMSGIEDAAHKANYTILLAQSHNKEGKEKQLIDVMKHRVDGLLVSVSKSTISYEHFEELKYSNTPVVFFDRIPNISNSHYVSFNMIHGMVQAINFLFKKGHRIIGIINGPKKLPATKNRLDAYIQAMTACRLKYDPALVLNCDLTKESVWAATEKLLTGKHIPTAIFTFNDFVALDALRQAQKMNFKINKDICFISYANMPLSNYSAFPPLASVEQFPYQQGQKAAEMLLELLHQKFNETGGGADNSYFKIF